MQQKRLWGAARLLGGLILACLLLPAASQAAPARYYLSLGDSLSNGTQSRADGSDRATNHGYVDTVGGWLRQRDPGVRNIKLGGRGTSGNLIHGPPVNPAYPGSSQLQQALAFIRAHRARTVLISVNVGDNDVEGCFSPSAIRRSCVNRGLASVSQNLPRIGRRLRRAAHDQIPIVGISDYDQFWAYWLRGADGRTLARRSARIIAHLNAEMDDAWRNSGARVADAAAAFHSHDTRPVYLSGHGMVPRAVRVICEWTWMCSGAPIGYDAHARRRGYHVIGEVTIAAIRSAFATGGTTAAAAVARSPARRPAPAPLFVPGVANAK